MKDGLVYSGFNATVGVTVACLALPFIAMVAIIVIAVTTVVDKLK